MRLMMVTVLACLSLGVSSAAAPEPTALASANAVLEEGLRLAPGLIASGSQMQCAVAPGQWPGLRLDQGRVVAADLLDEIGGYAREAGVTGGLRGKLRIVTSDQDYDPSAGEKPIPGSLRAALTTGPEEPRWIVFSLGQRTTITLKAPLRTPDNVTFDGTCSGVTIQAPMRVALMYIFDKRNVVIARLNFLQTDYVAGKNDDRGQTCIRLNGLVDAIAIMHNDVRRCGDGLIDITTSPSKPVPERARITIGYNRFAEHDKVMLFGTFTCGPTGRENEPCDARELERNRTSAPGLYLTLNDNLFHGTTQRHPRVFGRVMAHIVRNVIAYSSYGTFVSNGARALIEGNVYLMIGKSSTPQRAVWTTTTAGAMRMLWDVEGFIKARDNRTVGQAIIGENEPSLVDDPPYRQPTKFTGFDRLALSEAIACIAARAGPHGLSSWPAPCRSGS
jgi:pectate lyase